MLMLGSIVAVEFIAPNDKGGRRSSQTEGLRTLQFSRVAEQLDDVLQETSSPAAVEAAMIEAEREFGLRSGNELLSPLAPNGCFLSGAEAEKKRLIGQGNGRSPIQAESAEIGNGSDAAGGHLGSHPAPAGEID